MGLFDKVLKKDDSPIKFTQQQALSAVCLLAVASDGMIEQDEVNRIVTSIAGKKLFNGAGINDLGRMLQNSAKLVEQRGSGPVIAAVKQSLPLDLRETGFAIAADLTLSDGTMSKREQDFLEDFHKALEIPEEQALKIVEVIVIKNRG
jgi:tellurite resistance protein